MKENHMSGRQLKPVDRALPLIAVDIGNARTKVAVFTKRWPPPDSSDPATLPQPDRLITISNEDADWSALDDLPRPAHWSIGSVHRLTTTRLLGRLRQRREDHSVALLTVDDMPLKVDVEYPDRVGIDRLLGAVAGDKLRTPGEPLVLVDVGTAVTIDYLDAEGTFRGGLILPGLAMSARALHEFTDLLPSVETKYDRPPKVIGRSTEEAMQVGIFWSAVGAIQAVVTRLAKEGEPPPKVLLTGGGSGAMVQSLAEASINAQRIGHLTLAGIALTTP